MAGPKPKTQDIPITKQISDYDANSVAYSIQSDGLGSYLHTVTTIHNKSTGDYSVLMANVCNDKNLPNGDRLLETSREIGGSEQWAEHWRLLRDVLSSRHASVTLLRTNGAPTLVGIRILRLEPAARMNSEYEQYEC